MAFVLHVLPQDIPRGAQSYARELADRLANDRERHETLVLFDSEPRAEWPHHRLDAPASARRHGLSFGAAWALRRWILRHSPDVIVAHGGESMKYAVLARTRAPLVYVRIGTSAKEATSGPRGLFYRYLSRRAAAIVAVSNDVADQVRSLHDVESSLTVIPNGRDPGIYRPRVTPPAKVPVVAFVGALTVGKQPQSFLELVERLRSHGTDVEAWIAGDGPLRDVIAPRAHASNVRFLGARSDVAELLPTANVLVFPSRPEGEGMPGVLIEAGMCGVPVVATAVPGVADIVIDGQTGLIVPVDDSAALFDAVRTLIADANRRASMGTRARDHCVQRFALDDSLHRWRALLAAL